MDASAVVSSPCEDIWKKFDDFLLTPPQSPPIKLGELNDPLLDDFSSALDGFLEASLTDSALAEVLNSYGPPDVDVLHDCMWSGLEEQMCASSGNNYATRYALAETPLLGTSPLGISGFGDMLATCPDMDVSEAMDAAQAMDDESSHSHTSSTTSGFVSSNDSLINDHSYGSPKSSPRPTTQTKQAQSK